MTEPMEDPYEKQGYLCHKHAVTKCAPYEAYGTLERGAGEMSKNKKFQNYLGYTKKALPSVANQPQEPGLPR